LCMRCQCKQRFSLVNCVVLQVHVGV
jgi:hypothetical protein